MTGGAFSSTFACGFSTDLAAGLASDLDSSRCAAGARRSESSPRLSLSLWPSSSAPCATRLRPRPRPPRRRRRRRGEASPSSSTSSPDSLSRSLDSLSRLASPPRGAERASRRGLSSSINSGASTWRRESPVGSSPKKTLMKSSTSAKDSSVMSSMSVARLRVAESGGRIKSNPALVRSTPKIFTKPRKRAE